MIYESKISALTAIPGYNRAAPKSTDSFSPLKQCHEYYSTPGSDDFNHSLNARI